MLRLYVNTDGISDMLEKLEKLGAEADAAVEDMLMEGSDFLIDGLQRACKEYGHVKNGDLRDSIQRKADPEVTDDGGQVIVTFKGANEYGERYGAIAAYLNYGTARIKGDNWVDATRDMISPLVTDVMRQTLDRHLKAM